VSGQYPIWLEQIAHADGTTDGQANGCIEVTGHTSKTGSQQINEQLSLQRRELCEGPAERDAPQLSGHLIAMAPRRARDGRHRQGDLSDALDRPRSSSSRSQSAADGRLGGTFATIDQVPSLLH